MKEEESIAISNGGEGLNLIQKLSLILVGIGVTFILIAWAGVNFSDPVLPLSLSLSLIAVGTVFYSIYTYKNKTAGIKNDGVWFNSLTNRGVLAWISGIVITSFYIEIYWFPEHLGLGSGMNGSNQGLVGLFDPLSLFFKNQPASQWFVYGTIYTLLIISLGFKFILKYRHNRYHLIRTIVVMFSQLILAYLLPEILEAFNDPNAYYAKDLKNFWPLNYYFFEEWHLNNMLEKGGSMGMFYFLWGMIGTIVVVPIATYYLGKRWYCSWICGCGGLAETAGDPFRHLSSKKMSAWKLERWMIHTIMVFILIVTIALIYGYIYHTDNFFGLSIYKHLKVPYGFLIGSAFSGVIGVGFYPLLGNRVWCRFGCPLAGYMGIIQRFKSRFRITTNGGQCISCGNCSTYCEQGIDVRAYAQKGQNIVRASCVGCGVCSSVCPRGVLKLENGPEKGRIKEDNPIVFGNDGISLKEE